MEAFQLPADILDSIRAYFTIPQANEPCGAILIVNGKLRFKPLKNTSKVPDTFILDGIEYAAISRNILILVHGHDDNCIPSEHDISQSDIHNIPYLIFNLANLDYEIYWPKNYLKLCGRSYVFGREDCFEAAKSWYNLHSVFLPDRSEHWEDDWWLKGQDYISKEIGNWDFSKVSDRKYGDLLVFQMDATVPNHLGIYLGEDRFFHHAWNRVSCEEDLFPIWGKYIIGTYRYDKCAIRRLSWGEIW